MQNRSLQCHEFHGSFSRLHVDIELALSDTVHETSLDKQVNIIGLSWNSWREKEITAVYLETFDRDPKGARGGSRANGQ